VDESTSLALEIVLKGIEAQLKRIADAAEKEQEIRAQRPTVIIEDYDSADMRP
jgi:hypothetical protein